MKKEITQKEKKRKEKKRKRCFQISAFQKQKNCYFFPFFV